MSEAGRHELVMPFVIVQSAGGPYDDEALVVGYELGVLDAALSAGGLSVQRWIHSAGVPQADLIAMRYGYSMRQGAAQEEWTWLEFRRTDPFEPLPVIGGALVVLAAGIRGTYRLARRTVKAVAGGLDRG